MNLNTALAQLADRYELDADQLIAYADEDDIGGYHADSKQAAWPMGSVWEVEGKILYALVRALRPSDVLELGTYAGCSSAHIEAALKKNRKGSLTTVDNLHDGRDVTADLGKRVYTIRDEALIYLKTSDRTFDFIFEDLTHEADVTAAVWREGRKRLADNGVMVSHDAMHHIVGDSVRAGIAAAGVKNLWMGLIAPADCGLAVWRND